MIRIKDSVVTLVVACAQKRTDYVIYDFTKDVWNKCDHLREKIQHGFPSVKKMEFLTYVQFIQANANLGYDADEQNFPNDDEFPVGHPDYPVDESFTTVARKTRRSSQKFSSSCAFGFKCSNGARCPRVHSDEEKEYFKIETSPARRYNYKTKLCYHGNCKYAKKGHLCSFAHSLSEARCVLCDAIGLHWTDKCTVGSEMFKK